jgi:hemolysin III
VSSTGTVAARTTVPPKPRFRGRLHQAAFFACIPAVVALVVVAPGAKARVAALVYGVAILAQFAASAMYHRGDWGERALTKMRRLDHSMIFVLIAGTYTPMCLMALHGTEGWLILTLAWTGAAVGILTKLYRVDLHVVSGIMYIGLGWIAVFVLPALARALSDASLVLVIAGGLLYSVGALALATHHPDPWPETFGYHEVWHTATIAAGACFFAAILLMYLGH